MEEWMIREIVIGIASLIVVTLYSGILGDLLSLSKKTINRVLDGAIILLGAFIVLIFSYSLGYIMLHILY
jgi:hypothetical protein